MNKPDYLDYYLLDLTYKEKSRKLRDKYRKQRGGGVPGAVAATGLGTAAVLSTTGIIGTPGITSIATLGASIVANPFVATFLAGYALRALTVGWAEVNNDTPVGITIEDLEEKWKNLGVPLKTYKKDEGFTIGEEDEQKNSLGF
jgi:hypothetical protein